MRRAHCNLRLRWSSRPGMREEGTGIRINDDTGELQFLRFAQNDAAVETVAGLMTRSEV